jgi:hypothetical protein
MIAVHTVSDAVSGRESARLPDAGADAPSRDAGFVPQGRVHNLRRQEPTWPDAAAARPRPSPPSSWIASRRSRTAGGTR